MAFIISIFILIILMYLFLCYLQWSNCYNNNQRSNINKINLPWYDFLVAPDIMCETLNILRYKSSYHAAKNDTYDFYKIVSKVKC
jgi:hypothetical protein